MSSIIKLTTCCSFVLPQFSTDLKKRLSYQLFLELFKGSQCPPLPEDGVEPIITELSIISHSLCHQMDHLLKLLSLMNHA
ncbi:hypothetical protein EXN66_Car018413 [Channa argus]|uniref:Uncharacterized protein n=1 Tax=Channa argus TaxID=215402 RepID=A0A6G1QJJ9_CHAAH|nr:hypothetical protein EXN66_Car018413 [Channa argus]